MYATTKRFKSITKKIINYNKELKNTTLKKNKIDFMKNFQYYFFCFLSITLKKYLDPIKTNVIVKHYNGISLLKILNNLNNY